MEYSKRIDSEAINLFLNEVKDIQQDVEYFEEEQVVLDEIEQAADFLQKVGLSNLSEIYQQGCEISESVVNATVSQRNLTLKQVQTIKSRVQTLNKTLRSHQPRQKQRQDVRDVTWNVETSCTDTKINNEGIHFLNSSDDPSSDINLNDQQCSSLPYISHDSSNLPLKSKSKWSADDQLQSKGFTNAKYDKGDIARLLSDTVVLKGYHPIQESSFVSNVHKERSSSTSQENEIFKSDGSKINDSTNSIYKKNISDDTSNSNMIKINDKILSFENFIQKSGENSNVLKAWKSQEDIHIENLSIDDISESEYQYLRPFLWVEVTALFDQCNTTIIKRKANIKNKRGNVFGVNLSTLIMRDMPRTTDISMVPEIFKIIINHLSTRSLKEDGILRIGGQKQKLERLCAEIESKFYENKQYIENLLQQATSHEIVGVLKKLLRDLPDPIFTMELFDMFYKCNLLPKHAQFKALNILVLLLPVEHRNTFRLLLNFLINVIKHEKENHMSLHNVAMVAAPSFFPPKLLLPKESKIQIKNVLKEDIEKHINDAAVCCCTMETLLKYGDSLWTVPIDLVNQAREAQKRVQNRKDKRDYGRRNVRKELQRSNTQYQPNIISPRAKRDIFL
ncbi:rho GTPase-activating protein conundrum isoform X2 [Agrilus planipennis]|uniref:Rho GTPase-activating protein conundrum isoform X2 n=1 Tax=Agrilus planipennis TaxID=224129 RepID=A0A7F5RHY0_AGRPL|nr:rho GTPase-activating protein conundrum isoform X2 [Agrilus planipennis]